MIETLKYLLLIFSMSSEYILENIAELIIFGFITPNCFQDLTMVRERFMSLVNLYSLLQYAYKPFANLKYSLLLLLLMTGCVVS